MLAFLAIQAVALVGTPPERSGDWLVVCDHRRRCTALSQVPADGDPGSYPLAMLRRDGGVAALDVPIAAAVAPGTRLKVAVDGRVVAELVAPGGGAGLSLPLAGKLATAVRRGRGMTIAGAAGQGKGQGQGQDRISLRGLVGALGAIERGPAPPAAPPAVIAQPPAATRPPLAPSRKRLEKLVGKPAKGCGPLSARGYRLDAAHTLLEVTGPCAGTTATFVLPDKGDAQPPVFEPAVPAPGAWDPVPRRYRVLLPATPDRDCGVRRAYAWDGARFRLAEERLIAECRRATYEVVTHNVEVR